MSEKDDTFMPALFVALFAAILILASMGFVMWIESREEEPCRCERTTLKSDEIFIKNMKYIRELKENGGPI